MRLNHWCAAAVLGLVWISVLGCGSESKAPPSPAMPAPGPEKTSAEPDAAPPSRVEKDIAPLARRAAEAPRPAPPVPEKPGVEKDLGFRRITKASPEKDVARPPRVVAKFAPRPMIAEPEEGNPMRAAQATPTEGNPARPEELIAKERAAYEAVRRAQEAETAKSRKAESAESTAMEAAEPGTAESAKTTMAAPPDETESSPLATAPAPAPVDNAAESTTVRSKPAPEDVNEFLKMAEEQKDYTVVKVYYGTDRAALAGGATKQAAYRSWMTRTLLAAAVVLVLSLLGFRLLRWRVLRVLAYFGMFATAVLGSLTICAWFQSMQPDDSAKQSAVSAAYGTERGKLELGTCEVSIPKVHEVGQLESPSVLRLEFREDTSRHVVLLGVQPEPADRFYADLHDCVGRSQHKSAFVFVHGYNVSFEDAARRTAQIAYDLKFDGAPIFFSWPSQAGILQYTVDENNVSWSAPHLLNFLIEVARQSGAERIHLIAHSMGNRALTSALRDLSLMRLPDMPSFNEVILTAPDVDADTFTNDIAPAIVKTAQRVTLYASSNDEALIISKKVHGYPRAGDSGSQLIVLRGIDTVDVSAVDTSLVGHTYYGDNSTVLADIFELLNASIPADKRHWLKPERLGILKYWVFHR
jgi:esterase/lipase superfamily enzyme